jgi:hypothetical protein
MNVGRITNPNSNARVFCYQRGDCRALWHYGNTSLPKRAAGNARYEAAPGNSTKVCELSTLS